MAEAERSRHGILRLRCAALRMTAWKMHDNGRRELLKPGELIAPSEGARHRQRLGIALRLSLALALFAFASCATSGRIEGNKFAGKWRSSLGPQTAEYLFQSDGTFTGQVRSDGKLVADFAGRWSIQNKTLLYKYTGDRLGQIAPGTLDRDRLLAIEKDHYLIQAADGSRRKYVRVAD